MLTAWAGWIADNGADDHQVNGGAGMNAAAIEHIPGRGFRLEVEGVASELDYSLSDDRLVILHTGVPAELRGRGIAGQLVRAAFDHARAQGLKVVPRCSYAAEWIARHPEYADVAAGD